MPLLKRKDKLFATTEAILAVFSARSFCCTSLPFVLGWTLTFVSNLILKEAFLSGCSHISFLLAQACLSCRSRTSSIQQKFFVRERAGCFLCGVSRDVRAGAACLLAQGMPLRPGRALPFLTKRKEAKIRQGGSFDSLPLGTPTQRPKALPLETERDSRSGSYPRTGTACT